MKRSKSAAVLQVAETLAARGLNVAGFTQRVSEDGPGSKVIDAMRLPDGAVACFARTSADPGLAPAVCAYAFESAAFEQVRGWLEADAVGADVMVLDGVGKLELGGGGHRRAIELALAAGPLAVLAVCEDNLVYAIGALALGEPVASYAARDGAAGIAPFIDVMSAVSTAGPHLISEADRTRSAAGHPSLRPLP